MIKQMLESSGTFKDIYIYVNCEKFEKASVIKAFENKPIDINRIKLKTNFDFRQMLPYQQTKDVAAISPSATKSCHQLWTWGDLGWRKTGYQT